MSDPASSALARLRDPSSGATRALAGLIVDETTATPLRELASAAWVASQIATALKALTRDEVVVDAVRRRVEQAREKWGDDPRPLRAILPEGVEPPLRELLSRPYAPPERLTARIVRQPAMRELVARVLEDSITRFGRSMRGADTRVGGLGRRAASRGRALGKGLLAVAGVAEAASELAHAVSEEFEAALDRRVKEFLGDATGRALEQIVAHLADPDMADTFSDFRVQLLDEILDTPLADLAQDLDALDPVDATRTVIQAIRAETDRADFVARTQERVERALDDAGDGTLAAWLDELDLRETWTTATTDLLAARLDAVVSTPAFQTWWDALFAESASD